MKPLLSLALFCGAFGAALTAAEPAPTGPLDLEQTIAAVLARYPSLTAAQAAVDSARGRVEQSRSARGPQISADAAYSYLSIRPHVEFALPSGTSSFYTTIQDSYSANLRVRQLLTDFGRTDALVALAKAGELSAKDAFAQARSQLGYQTIQAFYGVILLRASTAVVDEEIASLTEAMRISEKKYNGGTATKFDLLTTQVRLAASRNRRTDTQAALEKQEAQLRQLLGLAPADPLVLVGDFGPPPATPDLSETLAAGLRNRPEMHLARDAERSSELALDATNRENRPVLAAQAAGGVEDGQLPELYSNRGYVAAGVSVSVPIFTGKRITGERISARADLRAAQARASELNLAITTDVADAFSDLKAAQARLANSDPLVDQAREALGLAKSRYSNGVITNFELLDAQSSIRGAELARLQARYDCALARQAVARAAGQPPTATP